MTTPLYQTNSYLRSFHAEITVLDTENHAVILDQTAFYPGGGGQPNDVGTVFIGGSPITVTKVKRVSGEILHFLAEDAALPPVGTAITGELDWDRRYQLMRTHTAMHILCGVVWRDYGAQVTGGNMDPLKGRMDFEFETMQQELVDRDRSRHQR